MRIIRIGFSVMLIASCLASASVSAQDANIVEFECAGTTTGGMDFYDKTRLSVDLRSGRMSSIRGVHVWGCIPNLVTKKTPSIVSSIDDRTVHMQCDNGTDTTDITLDRYTGKLEYSTTMFKKFVNGDYRCTVLRKRVF